MLGDVECNCENSGVDPAFSAIAQSVECSPSIRHASLITPLVTSNAAIYMRTYTRIAMCTNTTLDSIESRLPYFDLLSRQRERTDDEPPIFFRIKIRDEYKADKSTMGVSSAIYRSG